MKLDELTPGKSYAVKDQYTDRVIDRPGYAAEWKFLCVQENESWTGKKAPSLAKMENVNTHVVKNFRARDIWYTWDEWTSKMKAFEAKTKEAQRLVKEKAERKAAIVANLKDMLEELGFKDQITIDGLYGRPDCSLETFHELILAFKEMKEENELLIPFRELAELGLGEE